MKENQVTKFRVQVEAAPTMHDLHELEAQIPNIFRSENARNYAYEIVSSQRKQFTRNAAPEGHKGTDIFHILGQIFNPPKQA